MVQWNLPLVSYAIGAALYVAATLLIAVATQCVP